MNKYDIGLIGLGSMAQNLARNLVSQNHSVLLYGHNSAKTQQFIEKYGTKNLEGSYDIKSFVNGLKKSRKIIILVQAGELVDSILDVLLSFVEKGDIIMDFSDSYFIDTIKRNELLEQQGLSFLGIGLSGSDEQILKGTSIIGGGDIGVWKKVEKILMSIAAKDYSQKKCVAYIGQIGIAHYTNMVQNGLEYPIVQILAESYQSLKILFNSSSDEISNLFSSFNSGRSGCFLLESAVNVLKRKDQSDNKKYIIDKIEDIAGYSKGGMLLSIDALKRGIPIPSIMQAVSARFVSHYKKKRTRLSKKFPQISEKIKVNKKEFIRILESGIYLATISSFTQVFDLINKAAKDEGWNINLAALTRVWQGGSTIQGRLLDLLHKSYTKYEKNIYLFEVDIIKKVIQEELLNYKNLIAILNESGVNASVLTASYNYINMMFEKNSSSNFVQGLRNEYAGFSYETKDNN